MNKWKSLYLAGPDKKSHLVGFELTITVYKSVVGEDEWTKTPIKHDSSVKLDAPPLVNLPKFASSLKRK